MNWMLVLRLVLISTVTLFFQSVTILGNMVAFELRYDWVVKNLVYELINTFRIKKMSLVFLYTHNTCSQGIKPSLCASTAKHVLLSWLTTCSCFEEFAAPTNMGEFCTPQGLSTLMRVINVLWGPGSCFYLYLFMGWSVSMVSITDMVPALKSLQFNSEKTAQVCVLESLAPLLISMAPLGE